jgi:hypothetical protein
MNTQNLPATITDRLRALKQRAAQSDNVTHWQPSVGNGGHSFNRYTLLIDKINVD